MNVLGHDHVSENCEVVRPAHLLQNVQEQSSARGSSQPGLSLVTTASDEVQAASAIVPFQARGHEHKDRLGFCPKERMAQVSCTTNFHFGKSMGRPPFRKKRERMGHPRFVLPGNTRVGHPPT